MGRHPTTTELAELVHEYFANEGTEVSYDPEQGVGEALGAHFSVHNMASNLALIEPDEWPDFVAWHFRHLKDGPPDIPTEYPEVQKRLRVRLASGYWVDQLPFREIARPVADDLWEVLMVTIDGGASTLPPEGLEAWGEDMETVWSDARNNTLWDEPQERRSALKPTGERFTWIRGSWWVSTLLLDLGRYLSPRNPSGALAMVPVRDALFFHEIVDEGMVTSLRAMMEFGLDVHFKGPDSVSPHVYWWRDGQIQRVVACDHKRTQPVWGDDFRRMLAELEAAVDPVIAN